jgi:DNA invertase Pin-like site-specific DNA recombinase
MSAQLFRLRKYAADENLRVTQEVLDRGSAWTSPQLLQLEGVLEAARDINLVVHDETRFSRNAVHGAQLIRTCMRNRIAVHVVGIDDPYICTGRANWGRLRAGVDNAETESDIRSARASAFQRNRRAQRIASGWVPAPRRPARRQPPFGCRYADREGPALVPDLGEREAAVIDVMRRLVCGTEMPAFYDAFNRAGSTPPAGAPGAMGGERERLFDDYGREYARVDPGHIGPNYIYTLLNLWGICQRGARKWTRRAVIEAIERHLGPDVLAIALEAENGYIGADYGEADAMADDTADAMADDTADDTAGPAVAAGADGMDD